MRFDIRQFFAPLVAVLVLALTVTQTVSAVKSAGVWQSRGKGSTIAPVDPYAVLDAELMRTQTQPPLAEMRDPLGYAGTRVAVNTGPRVPRPTKTVATTPAIPIAPRPVLTSIIWDNDPRATIRYDGRDFSVRENSLFADFKVSKITSTQVVLERRGAPMVLSLRSKGD